MTETPQRRALHRSGAAVGVDFYLVAKSARFVAVIIFGTLTAWSDIKARKLSVQLKLYSVSALFYSKSPYTCLKNK